MGNTFKKKIDECSCKSSCQIEKDLKEIKKYFRDLSIDDLIHLKEYMEKRNSNSSLTEIKIESLL